ncbi:MAG: SPOR domain-containing protein [Bacteroidota bacterium]|nr:SPOR domain-containing protein [Bacteroidota bacterium]MDX5431704.1 SPOR domain-containing protein [Bacteroidota bacterium]MDX5470419.1 SPOR domain-containing protein [Bacteroidota bacterium]
MKKIIYLIAGFCVLLPIHVWGQADSGKVEVIADPRLQKIIERRTEFFQLDSTSQGYRIQIMSITDRKEAMLELENFQLKYPEIPVYLKYDSPNYKLRVGDFEDKIAAAYWFAKLKEDYPLLFLVPDKVNPKKIGE